MKLSVRSILILVALVLFVLAAFGVSFTQVALVPLGLAFLSVSALIG